MPTSETVARMVRALIAENIPAFLWGDTGVGKSESVAQVAAADGALLVDWRSILHDPTDLKGLPAADFERQESVWLKPAELPFEGNSAFPVDRPIYLFLDELNTASPAMQAACFGLVLERRAGPHKLLPNVRIIAAGNRQSDRGAAQRMPSPLANRFAHIDYEPDANAWTLWAAGAGIEPVVIAFIRLRRELLHKRPDSPDARAFPTPRSWARVSALVNHSDDIRPALIAANVGDAAAGEFEGFREIWRTLPPLESIIADPTGAPLPETPATRYAIASALARMATRANFDSVMAYARRLPPDFLPVVALEATRRDSDLTTTAAYIRFAAESEKARAA